MRTFFVGHQNTHHTNFLNSNRPPRKKWALITRTALTGFLCSQKNLHNMPAANLLQPYFSLACCVFAMTGHSQHANRKMFIPQAH